MNWGGTDRPARRVATEKWSVHFYKPSGAGKPETVRRPDVKPANRGIISKKDTNEAKTVNQGSGSFWTQEQA